MFVTFTQQIKSTHRSDAQTENFTDTFQQQFSRKRWPGADSMWMKHFSTKAFWMASLCVHRKDRSAPSLLFIYFLFWSNNHIICDVFSCAVGPTVPKLQMNSVWETHLTPLRALAVDIFGVRHFNMDENLFWVWREKFHWCILRTCVVMCYRF